MRISVIAAAAAAALVASCEVAQNQGLVEVAVDECGMQDYGNGVLRFNCNDSEFGRSLSMYIADHPGLEVVDIEGNGSGNYGKNNYFFVIVRPDI